MWSFSRSLHAPASANDRSIATDPSVDPLSTTTTSAATENRRSDHSNSAVSSHVFQETVTTVATTTRMSHVPTEEQLRIPNDPVHGTLVHADGPSPSPTAVLVVAGSGGGDRFSTAIARSLAAAGFAALGLGYFKVPGRPDKLEDIELGYFVTAAAELRARTNATRIVGLGSSRGSEAVFLTAEHFDALVGVVPANEAYAGWDGSGISVPAFGPIELERYDGPVLLLSAADDEIWPSPTMAADLAERRRRAGRPVVHHDEPGATHALSVIGPDHPGAWKVLLDFLRSH